MFRFFFQASFALQGMMPNSDFFCVKSDVSYTFLNIHIRKNKYDF